MSGDSQQHNDVSSEPKATTAPPPPFNPLTNATHDAAGSSIGNSVVRDLMKVYESLTQSSTPQTDQRQSQPQQQAHSQAYAMQSNPPPGPYHVPKGPPQPPGTQFTFPLPQHPYFPDPAPYSSGPPPAYMVNVPSQQQGGYAMPMPPHEQHQYPHGSSSDSRQQQEDDQEDDDNEDEEPQSATPGGRPRRKRRGSSFDSGSGNSNSRSSSANNNNNIINSKARKKAKMTDGRWSKRFTWPEDLHRDFVSAIFDVGLKHSSPATIMEHMPKNEKITTERIKSHLQKYRLHRAKSKKEFISSYDTSLADFQARGVLNGVQSMANGEVAAHLTFSVMNETKNATSGGGAKSKTTTSPVNNNKNQGSADASSAPTTSSNGNSSCNDDPQGQQQQIEQQHRAPGNDALMLPQLTAAEKMSPIGAAMGYLMGLFFSLKQQLMIQRAAADAAAENGDLPVQAVFNSFVGSGDMMAPPGGGVGQENSLQDGATMQHLQQLNQASSLEQQGKVLAAGTAPTTSPTGVLSAAPPSTRTNLEESNMMKREMKSQMALQNKMRALKQNELDKYKNSFKGGAGGGDHQHGKEKPPTTTPVPSFTHHQQTIQNQQHPSQHHHQQQAPLTPFKTTNNIDDEDSIMMKMGESPVNRSQGAGETAGTDGPAQVAALAHQERERSRALSVGGSDDFWNTDVVDDQLFEFLMNN
jgi:SHAQKYF class myb-like DNA-binding protein